MYQVLFGLMQWPNLDLLLHWKETLSGLPLEIFRLVLKYCRHDLRFGVVAQGERAMSRCGILGPETTMCSTGQNSFYIKASLPASTVKTGL